MQRSSLCSAAACAVQCSAHALAGCWRLAEGYLDGSSWGVVPGSQSGSGSGSGSGAIISAAATAPRVMVVTIASCVAPMDGLPAALHGEWEHPALPCPAPAADVRTVCVSMWMPSGWTLTSMGRVCCMAHVVWCHLAGSCDFVVTTDGSVPPSFEM